MRSHIDCSKQRSEPALGHIIYAMVDTVFCCLYCLPMVRTNFAVDTVSRSNHHTAAYTLFVIQSDAAINSI